MFIFAFQGIIPKPKTQKKFLLFSINKMKNFEELRHIYQEYASKNGFQQYSPSQLYEPLDYILSLGGKQMRPLLLLLSYQLFDKKTFEEALPLAYAIELFHNFSLIHDDIMDDANLRRGQPVVHVKYGTNTAILSGDVMLVYAYQYLTKSGSAHLNQLIDVFNQTAIGVCEGQQMDMNFESQDQVSIDEYIKMIELKTSVLLEAAMKMGAILADTDAQNVYHLGEFGKSMGLAFQMYDDYLDSFGDPELFGKKVGGDIIQNKKTFLYLKSLELAPTEIKNELLNLYANHSADNLDNKVARVKQIFLSLQADQYLMQEIKKWEANCISHLEALKVSEGAKQFLKEFLIQIMQRKF